MPDTGRGTRAAWWLGAAAGAALAAVAAYRTRDRERRRLDDDSRRAAPGRFVRLEDGWTHFEDRGPRDAQPVVLIHGFSVPAYIWDATVPALLEAGFRVIRYDVYGRGYSDRPSKRYDGALFERQLTGLLDLLGVDRPVDLVGLSMGGAIAAGFIAGHPARVRRLVLIDPYAIRRRIGLLSMPGLGEYLATVAYVPSLLRRQHADVRNTPWFADWVDSYREQAEYLGFRRALLSTARHFIARDPMPLFEAAAAAGKPTLLIWGERDTTVPVAAAARLREVLDPEYLLVRDAGHVPHAQRPDVVNPAIVRFLCGTGGGTREEA
ncbi:MAG TPA: alpha/beta hydrolase [Longimicrobiales bacterium]|nr:alpha/beta hydrolase [Longimicrobiales bacterium]